MSEKGEDMAFDAQVFDNSDVYFTELGRLLTRDDLPDCDIEVGEFEQAYATEYHLTDECGQCAKCAGVIAAKDREDAQLMADKRALSEVIVGRLISL